FTARVLGPFRDSPAVRGEELPGFLRCVEAWSGRPGVTTTVDLDEDDLCTAGASGGGEPVHTTRDILDGRTRAAIQVAPPLRHRRRCHDVAVSAAAEHRATVERHYRVGGAVYLQDRDGSRRRTRKRDTQRPGNRRDGGNDVSAFACQPVRHE